MLSTTSTIEPICNDSSCRQSTWYIAYNGHVECLKYAHKNHTEASCVWHSETTRVAALRGYLECLMYIYEYCGDIVSWEDADLEYKLERFPEKIQEYINNVREDWKTGLNRPGMWTKSAKRK